MGRLSELSIADRYRELADAYTATVDCVTDWDAPTPVAEWVARDVVGHMAWVTWILGQGSEVTFLPMPAAADDPVEAWDALNAQIQGILDNPEVADLPFSSEHMGSSTVAGIINQYFTPDVFMHRWDLARASGQDDTLDPELVHESLTGMRGIEPMLRESKQFGEQQPVPEGASEQDELIAFIGRDPRWTPGA